MAVRPGTETAWLRFLRAHAAITRELSSRLEALHGLTLSDFDVLIQLYFAEGRRMRRIDAIGEMRIEWHRHSDIAKSWHLRRGYQDRGW